MHATEHSADLGPFLPTGPYGPRIANRLAVSVGHEGRSLGELCLHTTRGGPCSSFRFMNSWLQRPDGYSASADLRWTRSTQWTQPAGGDGRNVFGAMADTQAQGFGLRVVQRAQARGLLDAFAPAGHEPSPMDALSVVLDSVRLGALRLRPAGSPRVNLERERFLVPWESGLKSIADAIQAFERQEEDLCQLLWLLYSATALGGERPKCCWFQDNGQLAVAKFPSHRDTFPITRLEVLTAQLARAAGIRVADHRLKHPVSEPIVLVERFDRRPDGARISYQSAYTLLQAAPGDGMSCFDLLDAMRIHCADYPDDARELWRRLLFNLLINHADADLRKVGFLHVGHNRWRLAPAGGLTPSLAPPTPESIGHNATSSPGGSVQALMQAASAFELGHQEARVALRHQLNCLQLWINRANDFSVNMSRADIARLEPVLNNVHVQQARHMLRA